MIPPDSGIMHESAGFHPGSVFPEYPYLLYRYTLIRSEPAPRAMVIKTMNTYVAFLRGINVGGNTMVSMKELAAICTQIGFENVRTYLNSGNVIFQSPLPEAVLQKALEKALLEKTGKDIRVIIRSSGDLERVVKDNPFMGAVPSQVGVFLGTEPVPKNVLAGFVIPGKEKVVPGKREVYVHYPDGMGRSKLKWPLSLRDGTMRNINTLTKLVGLVGER
jgi:uncharacterized protein (DUF1697 family)